MVDRFRAARSDQTLAVLEGFHALKHALRFGAQILEKVAHDPIQLASLAEALAPDIARVLLAGVDEVPAPVFRQLSPVPPATGVIALARRPEPSRFSSSKQPFAKAAPVVLLENPRSHGNVGAAVRVAAAAGAAGLVATGLHDPWHPSALVGSAGLHFALPVMGLPPQDFRNLPECLADRELVAVHPEGDEISPGAIGVNTLLAFGSEREGLSGDLLAAAHRRIRIPMESGVSSLNLATAVAVALYAWRLGKGG